VGAIINALNELLHDKGYLRDEDLRALGARLNVPLYRIEGLVSFYPHFRRTPPPRVEVAVCRDVSCRLAGGADHCSRVKQALEGREGVVVREVSCIGRCEIAPAAAVNEHPMSTKDLGALTARVEAPPDSHAEQEPTAAPRAWKSDPYASAEERYGVLAKVIERGLDGGAIIATLKESGLRGMGGAGFPTGLKWEIVRKEPSSIKYVVCNADESEPGTFKDRVILEELPHLVIEGMVTAGLVVGAEEGIVFIRHEYAAERTAIARAIEDARRRGVIGPNALGSGRRFELSIFVSPGGYILGEETALLECLEDKRGEPRNKPPFPGQKGLFGQPTLLNNVETLSLVPLILSTGPEGWKALGTRGCAGIKFIALSGDVERPGVYQVPMGTSIGELVAMAGGVKGGRDILAIAPGGASSNFLHADAIDAPLDFKALAERGSMLGSGAVLIIAEGADIVDLAANVVAFFRNESCGKCVPCRVGSEKAVAMLEQAVRGRGSKKHLELLPQLNETMAETSICGLGQVALAPFLSVMKAFEGDVRARFTEE
jgi:NADH:ubiquinone oxidoreductase subunit F (NADH-binding)/NADH:ubiquinone oxidoreductase subunit E